MTSPLYDTPAPESQLAEAMGLVVMPSNNTGRILRKLNNQFPGRLSHLMSPGGWRAPFMPYALDNGAYSAWARNTMFDDVTFLALLEKVKLHIANGGAAPLWLAVPDVVANAKATVGAWAKWAPLLRPYGWPLAFVVQDGMVRQDVPADADFVFVGGTKPWKWAWVPAFASWFGKRLHVGRVNQPAALEYLDQLGVGSCDGTGWFRGDRRQLRGLVDFLSGKHNLRLFDASEWMLPDVMAGGECDEDPLA